MRPLLFASTLLLGACGSRSGLRPPDQGEGGSGPGGSGATTTTTTGAGGGPTGTCDVLVVDGPPLSPTPAFEGHENLVPSLAPIEADGSRAAAVYLDRGSPGMPADVFLSSSVALDDPWGPWPDSLGPSASHGPTKGFAAGPRHGGRFSMLTTDEPNNEDELTGMVVWFPTAGVSGAQGQYFDDIPPGFPLFVTSNQADFLAGFQRVLGDGLYHMGVARLNSPITSASFHSTFACAIQATLAGAAVPTPQGFLAAVSNGRPFGKCRTDDIPDAPPSRLQVLSIPLAADLDQATLTSEYDESGTYIFQIRATPSATGAWIAWERIPFEPAFERRIQALQVGPDGFPITGQLLTFDAGTLGTPLAIASLGGHLALATTREDASGDRVLDVHAFTEKGDALAQITLPPAAGFLMNAGVALLASPAADRLLVAWDESPVTAGIRRVRIARLACAGGLPP